MKESFDGPHSPEPTRGEWHFGNWNVRQAGLSFGLEYTGTSLLSGQDIKNQLRIMNHISVACLLSTPDPMTEDGLLELPMRVQERLNKYLKGAVG